MVGRPTSAGPPAAGSVGRAYPGSLLRRGVALTAVVHLVGVGDAGDAGPVVVMGTLSP